MFEIVRETETDRGWQFEVQTIDAATGSLGAHILELSWADYNHWSPDGSLQPAAVAEAVVAFLRLNVPELPPRFDASQVRRRFTDADQGVRQCLRG